MVVWWLIGCGGEDPASPGDDDDDAVLDTDTGVVDDVPWTPGLTVVADGIVVPSGGELDGGVHPWQGVTHTLTLTLSNRGSKPVQLDPQVTGDHVTLGAVPDSLKSGEFVDVDVVVDPAVVGPIEADVALGDWGATVFATVEGAVPFVCVGDSGRVLATEDYGATWPHDLTLTSETLNGVTWGAGAFVAVATNGEIWRSLDGVSWTHTYDNSRGTMYDVAYGNGIFVAAGNFGNLAWSTDGIGWLEEYNDHTTHLRQVAYGNGLFVAVGGDRRAVTSDGVTWISDTFGHPGVDRITFGNGVFVAVGQNGQIATTTDGIVWTDQTVGSAGRGGVAFGNGRFVTGGWPDDQLWSTDGLAWTAEAGNDSVSPETFGNGVFLGVEWRDRVLSSPDGITWTEIRPSATVDVPGFRDCTYGATP